MEYTRHDIREKELAYIAGFMDGEGCIQIGVGGNLQISMDNSDVAPLQFIMDVFEGSITVTKRATEKHKKMYRWHIKEEDAPTFLKMLMPYLICKKAEAALGIEFVSASESRKLDINFEMRALKQRGKMQI